MNLLTARYHWKQYPKSIGSVRLFDRIERAKLQSNKSNQHIFDYGSHYPFPGSISSFTVSADNNNEQAPAYTDDQMSGMIDSTLLAMDTNDDGWVDFAEYRRSSNPDL